jgi:hypothetical protein
LRDLGRQADWLRDNAPEFKNPDNIVPRICGLAATRQPGEAAFVSGWIVAGGARGDEEDEISRAGRHFSEALRIADDLRGSGNGGNNDNYAQTYGEEAARQAITKNLNACRLVLEEKNMHTPIWREIFAKVWQDL